MASCIVRRKWFNRPAPGVLPKVVVPTLVGLVEAVAVGTFTPMFTAGVRSTVGVGGVVGQVTAQVPAAATVAKMGSAIAYTVRV
jgi:hypothetical protein